jgi:hypothetical protein
MAPAEHATGGRAAGPLGQDRVVAKKKLDEDKEPGLYKLLGLGMTVPAGIAVKKLADLTWLKVRGYPPPKNPAAPGVDWPEALAWAAASGALMGIGRLVAARGATSAYRSITGELPPHANADSAA